MLLVVEPATSASAASTGVGVGALERCKEGDELPVREVSTEVGAGWALRGGDGRLIPRAA